MFGKRIFILKQWPDLFPIYWPNFYFMKLQKNNDCPFSDNFPNMKNAMELLISFNTTHVRTTKVISMLTIPHVWVSSLYKNLNCTESYIQLVKPRCTFVTWAIWKLLAISFIFVDYFEARIVKGLSILVLPVTAQYSIHDHNDRQKIMISKKYITFSHMMSSSNLSDACLQVLCHYRVLLRLHNREANVYDCIEKLVREFIQLILLNEYVVKQLQ